MNSKINKLYILIFLMNLSCYSKIKITVDTFDRNAFLKSTDYQEVKIDNISNRLLYKISQIENKEKFNETINKIKSNPRVLEISGFSDAVEREIQNIGTDPLRKYIEAVAHINNQASIIIDTNHILSLELEGDNAYLQGIAELISKFKTLDIDFSNEEFESISNNILIKEVYDPISINSTSYGGSLYSDKFASLITRAPNRYWRKYQSTIDLSSSSKKLSKTIKARYNKVTASTFFGNSDIAVKMDQPGSFTVKGVRMDANESIKTSFKVLSQGIKYISFASGIPFPEASANHTSTAILIPSEDEVELLTLERDNSEKRFDDLNRTFLLVLMQQTIVLENDENSDEQKEQALELIKKAYKVYKNQLN